MMNSSVLGLALRLGPAFFWGFQKGNRSIQEAMNAFYNLSKVPLISLFKNQIAAVFR